MKPIKIDNYYIGQENPPYIIAEMSGNHNQSLERALKIVEEAANAGAQALKLQTYTADTMTLDLNNREFFIDNPESLWKGMSLYDLYKQAFTPWEWHKPIFDHCKKHGITAFSTPFDSSAVDFLERLKVPAYKIASPENTDQNLIQKVASTGKPLIISTGTASVAELDESIKVARQEDLYDIILLKCNSSYPANPKDSNLLTIPHMSQLFNVHVGLSDHSLGIGVAIASVALGAKVIEKHLTLSRNEGGVDSNFSMEPHELKTLVKETMNAWQSLGEIHYGVTKGESLSLRGRRSLYIVEDMKKGNFFTNKNIRSIRPGYGLPNKYYNIFIGKKINKDAQKGTPLTWDMIG